MVNYLHLDAFVPLPGKKMIIRVPDDWVLERKRTPADIAVGLLALGLPRRQIPAWLADRVHNFNGQILTSGGFPFFTAPNAIDKAFNDEQSMRWISNIYRFLDHEPKQSPQTKVKDRMRLLIIGLINQVRFHEVARPEILANNGNLGFRYAAKILRDGTVEGFIDADETGQEWAPIHCRKCVFGLTKSEKLENERKLHILAEQLIAEFNAATDLESLDLFGTKPTVNISSI